MTEDQNFVSLIENLLFELLVRGKSLPKRSLMEILFRLFEILLFL